MKVFAALGAGVCLLAIPAGQALAHSSTALPGLPTLSSSSSHSASGSGQSQSSAASSHNVHHTVWYGHDWGWLKHQISNYCRRGHGYGHGGFGWGGYGGGDGDGDGDDHRCHPHHPTSP